MVIFKNWKFNKEYTIEYFLSILFVYCNGTWLYLDHKTPMIMVLIVSLSAYLLYTLKYSKSIIAPNFIIIFLALFPLLCCLFNINKNVNFISAINSAITLLLLGCFTRQKLKAILDKYVNVIYFLAFVAIILNTLFLVLPQLLSFFPLKTATNFVPDIYGFYNLIVYTVRGSGGLRAQSIFWEPGAWAINQAFAIYWILFVTKDTKKFTVLLISIFLTFSTTGIALAVLLMLASLFLGNNRKLKRNIIITLSSILIVMTVVSVYATARLDIDVGQLLKDQLIGKFTGESETSVSFDQRKESTQQAFALLRENPIFGIGKTKEDRALFVTSSLAEISYQLGFIYLCVYFLVFRYVFKPLGLLFSFLFCAIMMNGEAYSFMILFSVIIIYGSKEIVIFTPFIKKLFHKSETDNQKALTY